MPTKTTKKEAHKQVTKDKIIILLKVHNTLAKEIIKQLARLQRLYESNKKSN